MHSQQQDQHPTAVETNASNESQLNTILLLFIVLRLTILFMFSPQGIFNRYTDYYFYYNTALLSEQGYFPFLNMWYEYPPLLAYLVQGVFSLVRTIVPIQGIDSVSYKMFALILGLIVMMFETGVLILIHRITRRAWGNERANWVSWVYTALSLPLFYAAFSHQIVAVFWMLLAVELFLSGSLRASAIAVGLGIATKITPAFLLGPIFKLLWGQWKKMGVYGALTALTTSTAYLPFLVMSGWNWITASFIALGNVRSWSTIWALIDGNWGPGNYGPLSTRLDPSLAQTLPGNPSILPPILILLLFAAFYAWVFFKKIDSGPREFIWFVTFTGLLFHLWSKGWSPQWATMVIPLLLIAFPDRQGLKYVLWLTASIFIEWPLADAFQSHGLLATAILIRTTLFVWVCTALLKNLKVGLSALPRRWNRRLRSVKPPF